MNYAKQYGYVLLLTSSSGGIPITDVLQLSPEKRLMVIKSLTALSKYLGCYDRWQQIRKQYNLKWSTGNESLQSFERFFDDGLNLDTMIERVVRMMRLLPDNMAKIVKFCCLTGLRPTEAVESVRLLTFPNQFGKYYNSDRQALEHFRYPEIFLRQTKKAYLSYITLDNLQPIAKLGPKTPGYNAIRLTCKRRKINMDMRYCRKLHGSWLHIHGITAEEVDFLQGRTTPSIFSRHYLTRDNSLKDRVLTALKALEERLLLP